MTVITDCLNISHQIWCLSQDSHKEVMCSLVTEQQQQKHHTIIITMFRTEVKVIALLLSLQAVAHDSEKLNDSDFIIHDFCIDLNDVLMSMSWLSHSLNFLSVTLIVHWCGVWNLTALQQQTCHTEWRGEEARSILLLKDDKSVDYLNAHSHSSHLTSTNSLMLRQYICTTVCQHHVLQDFFDSTCKACCLTSDLPCDNCLKKYLHNFMSFQLELLQEQSLLSCMIISSLFWATQVTSSPPEAVSQQCLLLIDSVNSNSADLKTFKLKWAHFSIVSDSMSLVSLRHSFISAFTKSGDSIHHISMSLDHEAASFSQSEITSSVTGASESFSSFVQDKISEFEASNSDSHVCQLFDTHIMTTVMQAMISALNKTPEQLLCQAICMLCLMLQNSKCQWCWLRMESESQCHHLQDCLHTKSCSYDTRLSEAHNTICCSSNNLTDIKIHFTCLVPVWLHQHKKQTYIRSYMCEFLDLVRLVVCIVLQDTKLCTFVKYCLIESLSPPALSNMQHMILLDQQYKSFMIKLLYTFTYLIQTISACRHV